MDNWSQRVYDDGETEAPDEVNPFMQELMNMPNIALTSDIWSSKSRSAYISVVAHWVDRDWQLQKHALSFMEMDIVHSGENIANKIMSSLMDWGISSRVIAVTFDNASANEKAVEILKQNLHPIADHVFLHQRCACHVIHLIVQDGLQLLVMSDSLSKVRHVVRHCNDGPTQRDSWIHFCAEQNVQAILFPTDLRTRWNSIYLMLNKLLSCKNLFSIWYTVVQGREEITDEDWQICECLHDFLKCFFTNTTMLSASQSPTSHFVLHALYEIGAMFKKHEDHPLLVTVIHEMKLKFAKYYHPVPILYCLAVVLDPRLRMRGLRSFMILLQETLAFPYDDNFNETEQMIFDVYRLYEIRYGTVQQVEVNTTQVSPGSGSWNMVRAKMAQLGDDDNLATPRTNNELCRFFRERFDLDTINNLDLLKWWQRYQIQFPVLSIMARDVLSVPASSVAYESLFSINGRILEERRSSLKPDMVEVLTVGKNWLLENMRMPNEELFSNNTEIHELFENWNINSSSSTD